MQNKSLPSSGRRVAVLLSGGLDSTMTMAIARREGFDVYTLTAYYGQRRQGVLKHKVE